MILALLLVSACDLSALTQQPAVHCTYSQTKESKLFKKKLASNGELWVTHTGNLRFDTLKPSPGAFSVEGGVARLRSEERVDTLPIDKLPKVNAFLGAFSGLFVGKVASLESEFSVGCEAEAVVLTPKSEAFSFLTHIKLGLSKDRKNMKSLELSEKNGDRSVITLEHCDASVPADIFQLK
jgi:outer membrane lipoprotein carrier protein